MTEGAETVFAPVLGAGRYRDLYDVIVETGK